MKKTSFFLSVAVLVSLASCSGGASSSLAPSSQSGSSSSEASSGSSSLPSSSQSTIPGSPLSLFNADSKFQQGSYNDPVSSKPLATYHHRDYGEVPYVELSQFLPLLQFDGDDAINALFGPGASKNGRTTTSLSVEKVSDHLYSIMREDVLTALIDTEEDVLTIKRYDILAGGLLPNNDGVWLDTSESNDGLQSTVHTSPSSKVLTEFKDEVYDLKKYHMDIVEADGKVYFPFQTLDSLAFRCVGYAHVYNGADYYSSQYLSASAIVKAGCYSANDTFLFEDVLHSRSEELLDGELCRYVATLPKDKWDNPETPKYDIFSLMANGEGAVYHANDAKAAIPQSITYALTWEIIEGEYYISLASVSPNTGEASSAYTTFRVLKDEGIFNTKTRSKALAEFNYDLLRFQFDEFYGLKEDLMFSKGYVNFDNFVTVKGLKEKLLSLDAAVYDEALAEFTMKYIDDGHTSYVSRSLVSGITEKSSSELAKEYVGPRMTGLKNLYQEYAALRQETLGEQSPFGLFIEGETAVIRFDAFQHFFSLIPPAEESTIAGDPSQLFGVSTPYGFASSFYRIAQNEAIKNVVIDITCNQGGAVLTVPYVAAYFSKDPTMLSREVNSGVDREFHYSVDLNNNGIFGEPEDTYEGKYNFYVLTSDFSFSCGSLLPAVAHNLGVKVIGKQGGGGACTVGAYVDACGSIYNVSSPMQTLYRNSEGKLVHDDAGVPVDYSLNKEVWYDLPKLNEFVGRLTGSPND